MKKLFLILSAVSVFTISVSALEVPRSFSEHILSNGMSVFVYEDFSTPITRVEYSAKAGVSMQSADNAGYFPLYAKLFSSGGKYSAETPAAFKSLKSECNADSARYILEASDPELEEVFEYLGVCAFAPLFGDGILGEKFREERARIQEEAFGAESFINAAIDSRVFSEAPWKHDSGIYPALFENRSISQVRASLMQIAKKYYTPQNSALFVSGPVKKEQILELARAGFEQYSPAAATLSGTAETVTVSSAQRKFVLCDPELSEDMAQIVVQYTSLSMEQADIAAIILESPYSALKRTLEGTEALNIRGESYINADAAHKNGSNRLILQTLLEKSGVSAFEQCAAFEKILAEKIADFSFEEFESAKKFLCDDFEKSISASADFMNMFSQFWAVDGISRNAKGVAGDRESLFARFLARKENIMRENYEELKFLLQNESPWIFALLNSKTFTPLKSQFAAAQWQSVTAKNGSWYTQTLYDQMKNCAAAPTPNGEERRAPGISNSDFIEKNKNAVRTVTLANGMRTTVKENPDSQSAAVVLCIKGQETETSYTMQEILSGAVCRNVQKAAFQRFEAGMLSRMPDTDNFCKDGYSAVTVECAPQDTPAVLECIAQALFYFETIPAEVDAVLSDFRSSLIMKTGSTARQLYCAGVKNFYKNSFYRSVFLQKEIEAVKYSEVLEASQKLLDAACLEIVAVGNTDSGLFFEKCAEYFSALPCSQKNKKIYEEPKTASKASLKVKLEHRFLTDISADKAGPRPAVLIPTTDFSDPVQYWIKAPAPFEKDSALFDALLYELREICESLIGQTERLQKMNARTEEKSILLPFGALTLFNVKNISDADSLLQKALAGLKEKLSDDRINGIKARFVKERYRGTEQNITAAEFMVQKIMAQEYAGETAGLREVFTLEYETVTQAQTGDFEKVFDEYFSKPPFKLYSADAKK